MSLNGTAMADALPTTITPLVRRHVGDAAFYWAQLDASVDSPQLRLDRLMHFNQLLDAHLDGLTLANPTGWQLSLEALQRWRGAGEAFVIAWLAIRNDDAPVLAAVIDQVRKQPDSLLRGVISALAWHPRSIGLDCIGYWSAADGDMVAQVAALRAAALMGAGATALAEPLLVYLTSPHAPLRAAACRVAATESARVRRGNADAPAWLQALHATLTDDDLAVRAEAAIALVALRQRSTAPAVLARCVDAQAGILASATGWYRKQAARRLARWVRHMAQLSPVGHRNVSDLLAMLPPRIGLAFALYHGDPAHLPFVLGHMRDPETARYAGWVWQTLTGIDLAGNGLTLPEPADTRQAPAAITDARRDADNGLPLPDAQAVGAFPVSLAPGGRVLLGQPLTRAHAIGLLADAPQAVRRIAAMALGDQEPGIAVNVRGPAALQYQALQRLQGEAQS